MVKLRKRIISQSYKRDKGRYKYPRYALEFPKKLNEKIEPLLTKNFEVSIASKDEPKQEIITISLVRKKTVAEEAGNKKLL